MNSKNESQNLTTLLKELSGIVVWFENQNDIDVEEGLERVKRGAVLVKSCKNRLKEIENEFREIQKDMENDDLEINDNLPLDGDDDSTDNSTATLF